MARTTILGILNITPDSFSDGGEYFDRIDSAVERAKRMVLDGADIIDIGGESSRPGSDPVSIEEELRRVIPVIERLSKEISVPISIDTYKPEVAQKAIAAGANMINDITGLTQSAMIDVAAQARCPVIIMHMQGQPKTMQENPLYEDIINDIIHFFEERIAMARTAGISQLILDPGIGFGKTLEHNLTILKHIGKFTDFGYPVLVGTSRKSFIGTLTGGLPADQRLEGTIASTVAARLQGVSWVRVHDVAPCRRALQVIDALLDV